MVKYVKNGSSADAFADNRVRKRPVVLSRPAFFFIDDMFRLSYVSGYRVGEYSNLLYCGNSREHFSFDCLKKSTATGGNIRHAVGESELVDTNHEFTATNK